MTATSFYSSCEPRWATSRSPERKTLGPAVAKIAEKLGTPLMPWQRQVADVGLEVVETERGLVPAYREVVFTVPRQSGKTSIVLAWEIHRALGWAALWGPQKIAYSEKTGQDARDKLLDDQMPLLEARKAVFQISKFNRSKGGESVRWANGSQLIILNSTPDAGHGKTIDLAVKDEFFADTDDRRDQALLPAMATRQAGQVLTCSTAGTADSVPFNNLVRRGRGAVDSGTRDGIAYFEWSADLDADPADPKTWWSCMPALGRTIQPSVIASTWSSMQDKVGEFRRAFLNIPTVADERLIPATVWDLCNSPNFELVGRVPVAFGLDIESEFHAAGAIVAGSPDGIEVAEYRPGVGWILDRAVELAQRYSAPFAVDPAGPAASFITELEAKGVTVIKCGGRDLAAACGRFFDLLPDSKLKVRRNADLDTAVTGVTKVGVGDAWRWGRKSSAVDISPLMAGTIGSWASTQIPDAPAPVELVVI